MEAWVKAQIMKFAKWARGLLPRLGKWIKKIWIGGKNQVWGRIKTIINVIDTVAGMPFSIAFSAIEKALKDHFILTLSAGSIILLAVIVGMDLMLKRLEIIIKMLSTPGFSICIICATIITVAVFLYKGLKIWKEK